MTPEKAQYHLLMLRLGQWDAYDRELDRILMEEDPLPPLILELAVCMSDLNQTISLLRESLHHRPADQQQVYDLLLADVHRKYDTKEWDAVQTAGFLWELRQAAWDFSEDPWDGLYGLVYEFELFEEGLISREVFEEAFDSVFCRDVVLDVWAMEAARHQKKKKPIFHIFRKEKTS